MVETVLNEYLQTESDVRPPFWQHLVETAVFKKNKAKKNVLPGQTGFIGEVILENVKKRKKKLTCMIWNL